MKIKVSALIALLACSFSVIAGYRHCGPGTENGKVGKLEKIVRKSNYTLSRAQEPLTASDNAALTECFSSLKYRTIAFFYCKDSPGYAQSGALLERAIALVDQLEPMLESQQPLVERQQNWVQQIGNIVLSINVYVTPAKSASPFVRALAEDALKRSKIDGHIAILERLSSTSRDLVLLWGPSPNYYLVMPSAQELTAVRADDVLFELYAAIGRIAHNQKLRLLVFKWGIPTLILVTAAGVVMVMGAFSASMLLTGMLSYVGYALFALAPYETRLDRQADLFAAKLLIKEGRSDSVVRQIVGDLEKPLGQVDCEQLLYLDQFLAKQGIAVEDQGYAVWKARSKLFSSDEQKAQAKRQLVYVFYVLKEGAQEGILESCLILFQRQALYAYNMLRELGQVPQALSVSEIDHEWLAQENISVG